ncbi:anti-sigma factor [Herbiconiux sp. A18JL235]|uniref:Anti-sigma factor n=1 Tax=Herbiconiux sp. A18JL235 TaxID=3152363 RepID=A0AB39BL30_9MICO
MNAPDPFRDWDAAYVLGMLSADERRAYEDHLTECPPCAAAVGELAGMPGILSRLSADEATALLGDDTEAARAGADADLAGLGTSHGGDEGAGHQPSPVRALARSVGRRRSRARRRVVALVAGTGFVLALAGVGGGWAIATIGQTDAQPPVAATEPATEQATEPGTAGTAPATALRAMAQVEPGWIDAELLVTEKGWGTRFDWDCSYQEKWVEATADSREDGVTYDLVVTDRAGAETTVASWTAYGEDAGNLSASTSIATADIRSVDIRVAGTDRPIVRTVL